MPPSWWEGQTRAVASARAVPHAVALLREHFGGAAPNTPAPDSDAEPGAGYRGLYFSNGPTGSKVGARLGPPHTSPLARQSHLGDQVTGVGDSLHTNDGTEPGLV